MSDDFCLYSKRSFLVGGGAAIGLAACNSSPTAKVLKMDTASLDELAKLKGLRFGAAVGAKDMADRHVREILQKECGVLGAENAFKWKATHPKLTEFSFGKANALVKFAKNNAMKIRGHALIWVPDKNMPAWAHHARWGAGNAPRARKIMKTHIDKVCKHFGNDVTAWDVVNEGIKPSTGEYDTGMFFKTLGPEYIDLAFHYARAAAPHAKLVYNDYMRWSNHHPKHHMGVLKLLERLKKNNVPCDALGIQSHLRAFPGTENDLHWRGFLKEVSDMGYDIILTELDVRDKGFPAKIEIRDQMVADHVKHYLDITLDNKAVKEVHTWGITDKYTVRQRRDTRLDGLAARSLPFAENYKAKPMRAAIAAAFEGAPAR